METRAARPSSFTQQLQSHAVHVSPPTNHNNVDDTASDHRQTHSQSSSSSKLHETQLDEERRAGSSADVRITVDASLDKDLSLIHI